MEIDLSLMGTALEVIRERTITLHALGADGVFAAEGPHDVFAPLYLAAAAGTEMALMTNAAIALPRNPIHLAHAAFDLQRLSQGRFRLGIAPQISAHITRRFGLEWSKPVARMGDLIDALHAIFDTWQTGCVLDHQGPYYRHTLMTPMFSPGPLEWGPPAVILGALGPVMTTLGAQRADGVSILPFNSEAYLRATTWPAITAGLKKAARDRSSIEVVCGAIVGVGATPEQIEAARGAAKALLGFYGSTPAYRPVLESIGRDDLYEPLAAAVRSGDFTQVGRFIDDDVVDALAIVGTPSEVARRVEDRFGWIADRVSLFLPFEPDDETLAELLGALTSQRASSVS